MTPTDTLLSLDMGHKDCIYRLRRDYSQYSTVVYVHLQDLCVISEDRRTFGPSLIKDLRAVIDIWDENWTTLDIYTSDGKVHYHPNAWKPSSLHISDTDDTRRVNVLDLRILHQYRSRVFLSQLESTRCILKIYPFKHQMPYLTRELRAYDRLSQKGYRLSPRLLCYVFERERSQIIGFVCEELDGEFPRLVHLEACERALTRLHAYGIVHGDLNIYNIIVTPGGPKFIDFEEARLDTYDKSRENFVFEQQREYKDLQRILGNTNRDGKPWLANDV